MVMACHCEGNGWNFWGDTNIKSKFWGQTIQLDPVGVLTLEFDDGETFRWSKVDAFYSIVDGKHTLRRVLEKNSIVDGRCKMMA
jgi:oxysterol-binding protein 1